MLRALVSWLTPARDAEQEPGDSVDENGSSSGDSTFLPSRLDASVLSSHGARTANESVQELESEAGELAEEFPDHHQQFEDPKQ